MRKAWLYQMFLGNKEAYESKLFDILNPVLLHYSPGGARLRLGFTGAVYSEAVAEAEAFIRVLWGLGPFLGGHGNNPTFEKLYLKGLANGTDPQSDEYWGNADKGSDQRLCEMAGIAAGLLFASDKLWDPLSDTAKDNVAAWLNTINQYQVVPNNWQFFPVLVNVAFKQLGRPEYNQDVLNQCLSEIDSFYEGEGWYRDGVLDQHDYYIAFAFHYYGLIYYAFMREDDPVTANKFRDRALLFGKQFVYWFSDTGAAIPYGRSLTYRFAEVAYFSACIFAGIEPIPMSAMKGIIDRHFEYWWGTNMKELSGVLSIGYAYPNLIMAEAYNAPGSPLWALKAFILLALDRSHPYWSAEAGASPKLDEKKWLPVPEMIVTQQPDNAILYTSGVCPVTLVSGHMEEKYSKFAYSSKYGFSIRKANDCLENMAPDCDLVFKYGGLYFGRNSVSRYTVNGDEIVTQWSPLPGIEVTTTITPNPLGHMRRHIINSSLECVAYDCGFSVPTDDPHYSFETDNNAALVHSSLGSCMVYVYSHSGSTSETNGIVISASPNTNLLFPRSAIPAVSHNIAVGITDFSTSVIVSPSDSPLKILK